MRISRHDETSVMVQFDRPLSEVDSVLAGPLSRAFERFLDHNAVPDGGRVQVRVPMALFHFVRSPNSVAKVADLAVGMRREGQLEPIEIGVTSCGRIVLYDGNHRLAAARYLGWSEIDAVMRGREAS